MPTTIDYSQMIDRAMRQVVRESLELVQKEGLPETHHFYISFLTTHPDVKMSETLRAKYPEEMTIVLQHQFWDLKVDPDKFTIMLSFNNIPERLVVPFSALVAFADPSIKFGLQFHAESATVTGQNNQAAPAQTATDDAEPRDPTNDDRVVSIDRFRKK